MTIIKNAAECRYCGYVLESKHRHDFRLHVCESAGMVSKEYSHKEGKYVAAYPTFMVDGGLEYIRRLGDSKDYIERSQYDDAE